MSALELFGEFANLNVIRTPEQIAAEEREKAIAEMVYGGCGCDQGDGTTTAFAICGLLYDAGYRRFEIVES